MMWQACVAIKTHRCGSLADAHAHCVCLCVVTDYATSKYAPFCGRAAGKPRWWQTHFDLYNTGRDDDGEWNNGISGNRGVVRHARALSSLICVLSAIKM